MNNQEIQEEINNAIEKAASKKFESNKFDKAGYWWVKSNHDNKNIIVLIEDYSDFNDDTPNIYPFKSDMAEHESNFTPISFISETSENDDFSRPTYYMTPEVEKF